MYYSYVPSFRDQQPRVMTVTGTATISVEPNIVMIELEVVTQNESLTLAQQENAQKINQVMQALLQFGIPRENIQTATYNIYPRYDYVDGKQVFRGYEVTHALTVKMDEGEQVGEIIDAAVQNGVNRVSAIEFTVADKQHYYQQALSAALRDATAKAQTIAETMELNLDPKPLKIVEEMNESPAAYKAFATMEENTSTTIEPGQIKIMANVRTKFQFFA
ncbi:SIMPL domain-containing protein [Virgibacillus sp. FSP13]